MEFEIVIQMKMIIRFIVGFIILSNPTFAQHIDTLKVFVMTPYEIDISENFKNDYSKLKSDFHEQSISIKKQKLKEKQEHIEEYKEQPDYTRRMYDNELDFYDSLTIDNYISSIVREYIAHRLFKPFKIKPRLVLVQTTQMSSDKNEYMKFCGADKNVFIINFPSIKLEKVNHEISVKTRIELYSRFSNEILMSKELIGLPKQEMTDYPMCNGNGWDCAFVNSVYPNLFDIIKLIVEKNTMKN